MTTRIKTSGNPDCSNAPEIWKAEKLMDELFSIGVDLGGTNLRIASYAEGTDFLDTILVPTRLSEGRDRVVRDMCEAINALAKKDYGSRRLAGIGIGTPGPLELPEGIL